eukprot:Gb_06599 [translate_table: standard]
MGRRKSTNSWAKPRDSSIYSQAYCSMKDPHENCTSYATPEKPKPAKRMKACDEQMKYGSVTPDVSSCDARSKEMCKKLRELEQLRSISKTNALPTPLVKSVNPLASRTSPSFTKASNLHFSNYTEGKHSCEKVLFPSSLGCSSFNNANSLHSTPKLSTSFVPTTMQQVHSKVDSSGCSEILDISGPEFSVVESGSEREMFNQEGPEICEEIDHPNSEPEFKENGTTKVDSSVDTMKDSPTKSMDQIVYLKDTLQASEFQSIEKERGPGLDRLGDCEKDLNWQKQCPKEEYKVEQGMRSAERADEKCHLFWIKGELENKKTNELEKVADDIGTEHYDCKNKLQSQIYMEKEVEENAKDMLNSSVEAVKGLQVDISDQKMEELHDKKPIETGKVVVDTQTELDILNDSLMEFPWQTQMQDGSDEDENDELSSMWRQMSLSFECSKNKSIQEKVSVTQEKDKQDCNHSFMLEDDLGYVCKTCGFIGQSIETIFDFPLPKARKGSKQLRHVSNKDVGTISGSNTVEIIDCKKTEQKSPVLNLVLHPRLKKHMKFHQLEGFNFLQKNLITEEPGGCILAHAPGTGKTFLVISFIQSFLTKYPDERPLIVAPKSILCSWMKEFKKWEVEVIPLYNLYEANNKSESLRGNQLQILREWEEKKSILLVSYSQFSSIVCEKTENQMTKSCQQILLGGPGLLILDEGHFPRNKDTNIVDALSQIHTRRRVLLSGTLYQNNIKELFNLLRLVRPDILQLDSFQAIFRRLISSISATERHSKLIYRRHSQDPEERIFCDALDYALQNGSKEMKKSALQDLQELAALFVHYYKGDILEDLPGLVDFTVKLNLYDNQRAALNKLQHFVGSRMSRDIMSAAVCIHPSLEGENPSGWLTPDGSNVGCDVANINADPKEGVKTKFVLDMLSLCESNKEKLLVFSQYLPPLTLIENMIINKKHWSKGTEILRLDGNTPAEVRERIIEQFNHSPDSKVLFASIRASGEGISLVGANRVVILDIPWNPSITRQAISRAYRIGQKKKVFAYRLVAAHTLEEEIHQTSLKKELMSKMLFEGGDEHEDITSIMSEVQQDDCEDMFFESSALRENVKVLYLHKVI